MEQRETAGGASRGLEIVRIQSGSCKGEITVTLDGDARYSVEYYEKLSFL